ncbi:hypothetical protein [Parabacteroides faecis]|uniref:Small-conductance mechanosensitive channel n=1 Tax=Parabacteroides faecis TaxID=1217282 RepID=A0ABR6KQ85_9BACT|nr:hypothetical protein [Parabacteroides faecis]MBB4623673.1 small-conductance mechanosensitive channel [Parabacteroides faecis]GGK01960.1 hypothetical protein GCM10007084_26640 [Parabacteroides faecis]
MTQIIDIDLIYFNEVDNDKYVYSALHQNIQDYFDKAGVEIMSPHYTAFRNGNASTIPKKEETKTN